MEAAVGLPAVSPGCEASDSSPPSPSTTEAGICCSSSMEVPKKAGVQLGVSRRLDSSQRHQREAKLVPMVPEGLHEAGGRWHGPPPPRSRRMEAGGPSREPGRAGSGRSGCRGRRSDSRPIHRRGGFVVATLPGFRFNLPPPGPPPSGISQEYKCSSASAAPAWKRVRQLAGTDSGLRREPLVRRVLGVGRVVRVEEW